MALSACGTTEDDGDDAGDGSCSAKIAFLGPQTGDYANLGINIVNGAKLALDEYEGDCEVELEEFDSQGDPEKATPLVTEIINDSEIIGVVGPTFSGESDATGEAFSQSGLVVVSPSATNPDLTSHGWDTFHRIIGNDATQAPAAVKYIQDTVASTEVFVIDDSSEYGKGLGDGVRDGLGDAVIGSDQVQQKETDFSATVTKVKASDADTVFYAGYYPEAGLMVKQLRQGGWDGVFVSDDGSLDPGFINAAGAEAAEDSRLTCPCLLATGEFAADYEALNGQAPGTYSPEGYDAMNVFLNGLDDGSTDRESMLEFVNGYDGEGITKNITFTEEGEVGDVVIYAYTVADGEIQPGEPIE